MEGADARSVARCVTADARIPRRLASPSSRSEGRRAPRTASRKRRSPRRLTRADRAAASRRDDEHGQLVVGRRRRAWRRGLEARAPDFDARERSARPLQPPTLAPRSRAAATSRAGCAPAAPSVRLVGGRPAPAARRPAVLRRHGRRRESRDGAAVRAAASARDAAPARARDAGRATAARGRAHGDLARRAGEAARTRVNAALARRQRRPGTARRRAPRFGAGAG